MRRPSALAVSAGLVLLAALPGLTPQVAAADPYVLESTARYDIQPDRGVVEVEVALEFTNTTPDTGREFSVFNDIRVAVHDQATEVAASDAEGSLQVQSGVRGTGAERIQVANIHLREPLRYNESVRVSLTYVLPDTERSDLRVRPSLVAFPAWSFGTSGTVSVTIPDGYEMRVDGDPLEEDGDRLVSGPIDDPTAWLALVTAIGPSDFSAHETTVPLEGGTADLVVRAFADDPDWGERTLEIAAEALPLIEADLGLPYPIRGQLVVTEAVAADRSGLGESASAGAEVAISFEQPAFTALHQLVHVWLSPALVEARWIGEGLASDVAARVGEQLDVDVPSDPADEAADHADAAFPLDAWPDAADPEQQAYGYAASWDFMRSVEEIAGPEAIRTVLARVASSVGPYELAEVDPQPGSRNGSEPVIPLTGRSFLDQLEAVTDADLDDLFAERVLSDADVELLEARAAARARFDDLVADADGWGSPDPVRAAMAEWRFEDAMAGAEAASEWLGRVQDLRARLREAGIAATDRLQQAYRAYGGGGEADAELRAEGDVVDAYAAAAARINGKRTFIERLGLVGGPDPAAQLEMASGRFTAGDLGGAIEAIDESGRIMSSAEAGGIVRLVSLALVVLILIGVAIVLFRRRASYTRAA